MYTVIIGDIINSKKIEARGMIQIQLKVILDKINEEYSDYITSKFIITLGDEFQGVLNSPTKLLEIVDKIRFRSEIDLRFGIGLGKIYTEINYELSIGADGPAFWNARDAIKYIHDKNDFKRSNIRIISDSKSSNLVNEMLGLCGYIESTWLNSQKDLIKKLVLLYGYNLEIKQVEIARTLQLSTQNTYLRLKKMGYYNYIRSRIEICEFLSQQEDK